MTSTNPKAPDIHAPTVERCADVMVARSKLCGSKPGEIACLEDAAAIRSLVSDKSTGVEVILTVLDLTILSIAKIYDWRPWHGLLTPTRHLVARGYLKIKYYNPKNKCDTFAITAAGRDALRRLTPGEGGK